MSAVALVTGHFYRDGLLVCSIHGWSCRWVEPRLLEIASTLSSLTSSWEHNMSLHHCLLYCDCSMCVRHLLMMFLCITYFISFSEVLYLELIFKSLRTIYYPLLRVKKTIMLSRLCTMLCFNIAFVTGLSHSCPEMDQWLRFKPWICFVLFHSFWAVN